MKAASEQLLKQKIQNTPQEELPLLLLEGAINFIKQAKEIVPPARPIGGDALGFAKQIEAFSNKVMRAHRIVFALNGDLNMEAGGEIARNLRNIYISVGQELGHALRDHDAEKLGKLADILQNLYDGLADAVRTERGKVSA
jgi:flagellar protein FliS